MKSFSADWDRHGAAVQVLRTHTARRSWRRPRNDTSFWRLRIIAKVLSVRAPRDPFCRRERERGSLVSYTPRNNTVINLERALAQNTHGRAHKAHKSSSPAAPDLLLVRAARSAWVPSVPTPTPCNFCFERGKIMSRRDEWEMRDWMCV